MNANLIKSNILSEKPYTFTHINIKTSKNYSLIFTMNKNSKNDLVINISILLFTYTLTISNISFDINWILNYTFLILVMAIYAIYSSNQSKND